MSSGLEMLTQPSFLKVEEKFKLKIRVKSNSYAQMKPYYLRRKPKEYKSKPYYLIIKHS